MIDRDGYRPNVASSCATQKTRFSGQRIREHSGNSAGGIDKGNPRAGHVRELYEEVGLQSIMCISWPHQKLVALRGADALDQA